MEKTIDRFNDKYEAVTESGCWIWMGSVYPRGYGYFHYKNTDRANRAAYMLFVGDIPDGKIVCHTCDVPEFVNPDHLFLGTNMDNARDMVRKNRQAKGVKINSNILTEAQALEIRSSKVDRNILAEKYKISKSTIYDIKTGRTWKHLPPKDKG